MLFCKCTVKMSLCCNLLVQRMQTSTSVLAEPSAWECTNNASTPSATTGVSAPGSSVATQPPVSASPTPPSTPDTCPTGHEEPRQWAKKRVRERSQKKNLVLYRERGLVSQLLDQCCARNSQIIISECITTQVADHFLTEKVAGKPAKKGAKKSAPKKAVVEDESLDAEDVQRLAVAFVICVFGTLAASGNMFWNMVFITSIFVTILMWHSKENLAPAANHYHNEFQQCKVC